jgi:hypothetical protein
MRKVKLALVLWMTLMVAGTALAQAPAQTPTIAPLGRAAGFVTGLEFLDEDLYLKLRVGMSMTRDQWAFGVGVPLRLRLMDQAPEESGGVIRKQDWDQWQEWSRIIRFVEYGKRGDPFHLRAGELVGVTIGHGTLVHRYYNTLDINRYRSGALVELNSDRAGCELLTDDFLGPRLLAARTWASPIPKSLGLDKLRFGVTVASDLSAPWTRIIYRADGVTPDVGSDLRATEPAVLYGFDLSHPLLRSGNFGLDLYSDFNFAGGEGFGWHPGLIATMKEPKRLDLEMRAEYRYVTARYAPSYFNAFHDFERSLPIRGKDGIYRSKWRHYMEAPGLTARHGVFAETYAILSEALGLGLSYEDYQGPDNTSVMARAELPYVANLKLGAYYSKRNFGGLDQLFDRDRSQLVLAGRYRFLGFLFAFADYSLYWIKTSPKGDPISYQTLDSLAFGVGAEADF